MTIAEKLSIRRPTLEFLLTVFAAYLVFKAYSASPLLFTSLLVLGAITVPLLLKQPEYAPLFVALLLPFQDIYIVSIFHIKRILVWSLLAYVLLRCPDILRKKFNPIFRRFAISTALFVIAIALSLLTASTAINTTVELTGQMFRKKVIAFAIIPVDLLAMMCLMYLSTNTSRGIRRILDVTLVVSLIVSLLGIGQYYFKKPVPGFEFLYDPEFKFWGRATSVFINPNEFGAYLSVMIIVALFACILETTSFWKRFGFYLPIACVNIMAELLSFSRGALIQTIIGGLIGFFVYHFKFLQKKISWKFIVFIISLTLVLIFSSQIYDGFMRLRLGLVQETEYQKALYWTKTASDSLRKYTIIQALCAFKDHPIFGVGFNMFSGKNIARGLSSHNYYLKALAEMGLVGFIPFMFMLGAIITTAWKCLSSLQQQLSPEEQHLALLLFVGICTAFPGAFFTDTLFDYYVNGNLWLFIGAVFVIADKYSATSHHAC